MYDELFIFIFQIVQMNKSPVVITFIADSNTNTGKLGNITLKNDRNRSMYKVLLKK